MAEVSLEPAGSLLPLAQNDPRTIEAHFGVAHSETFDCWKHSFVTDQHGKTLMSKIPIQMGSDAWVPVIKQSEGFRIIRVPHQLWCHNRIKKFTFNTGDHNSLESFEKEEETKDVLATLARKIYYLNALFNLQNMGGICVDWNVHKTDVGSDVGSFPSFSHLMSLPLHLILGSGTLFTTNSVFFFLQR